METSAIITRKVVPQRGWRVVFARAFCDHERLARLVGADRLVLGTVILKHAPDVGDAADQAQIADDDRELERARQELKARRLDREAQAEELVDRRAARSLRERDEEGQRDDEHEHHRTARPFFPSLSGASRALGRRDREHAKPERREHSENAEGRRDRRSFALRAVLRLESLRVRRSAEKRRASLPSRSDSTREATPRKRGQRE
jgi:hypothetical protein